MAAQDDLITARANACARLAELDTLTVDERIAGTFSDGVRSYDFNGYRAALIGQIEKLSTLIQIVGGPFEVVTVGRG